MDYCAGITYENNIYCANCGAAGHLFKSCNHPITSYGIICYRLKCDLDCVYPEYLMVQRKDSLSYVEFLRGKYDLEKRQYICKLFSHMTDKERRQIQRKSFDSLWRYLWQIDECNAYQREYNEAKRKFNILKKGYIIKNDSEEFFFNIDYILSNTVSDLKENEWGFPKGRRNINEQDFTCALREFREESGVDPSLLEICLNQKPFEEIFNGSNKVRYRHVYYVATIPQWHRQRFFNPKNKVQVREIKDVRWFKYSEAQVKISNLNVERKELLRRVHQLLLKNIAVKYK